MTPKPHSMGLRTIMIGFLLVACQSADLPTPSECDAITQHLIDVRVKSAQLPDASADTLRRHREQLSALVGTAMSAHCESTFDRERYTCLSKATTIEELDDCSSQGQPSQTQDGARQ